MTHTLQQVPVIHVHLTKLCCASCGLVVVGFNIATMSSAAKEHECGKKSKQIAIWT